MKLTRTVLMAGLLIVPVMMLAGCGDQSKVRSGVDNNIKNAKILIGQLKTTFEGGTTSVKADPNNRAASGDTGQDSRMAVLAVLVAEKIPYTVNKRVTDDAKKKAALEKLGEITKFIDSTLIPKYNAAQKSGKAEDAKALAPLMGEMDKNLDEVIKVLY
jgi:hypothetical protein